MSRDGRARDGRTRPESWITFAFGLVLGATAVFLVVNRESVSEATLWTLLIFAAVFTGKPLPDILRRAPRDEEDEDK